MRSPKQKACAFLVQVLSPVVSSAYVVQAHPENMESSRMLATYSLNGERAPVLSRRVIGGALHLDGSVTFFNHATSTEICRTTRPILLPATSAWSARSRASIWWAKGRPI
ncbi:hypothetical protein QTH89_00120 [Variovorax sp. J22G21]|uniref:hypothetical protein n=1 Tax=Variovorax fucosicus TaxID=3053517 RepID=UPI0025777989|nr:MULTISPECIES: hypothetical protein [unclassified Variovorax]MDM0041760.1 hypothetical protein [Variovorax sp. J22R193]MDM0056909.1 hypothetical protein [Variovorax sp. J22G47]MDM0059599.1 hypothetical protein [Variovorax sp. J22G21]